MERRRSQQAKAAAVRQYDQLMGEVGDLKQMVMAFIAESRESAAEARERLDKQDIAIAVNTQVCTTVATDTAAIRTFWTEGINASKFFCRLAAGWVFLYKKVAPPLVVLFLVLYVPVFYMIHRDFPDWLIDLLKFAIEHI